MSTAPALPWQLGQHELGKVPVMRYDNALFGWLQGQHVLMPDVKRATVKAKARMVRELADMAGRTIPDDWTDDALAKHEFPRRAGRFAYVEIEQHDGNTFSYHTPSSGGGNYPLANLRIVR